MYDLIIQILKIQDNNLKKSLSKNIWKSKINKKKSKEDELVKLYNKNVTHYDKNYTTDTRE